MFQNVFHHLSYEQIQFLDRGPTYVIPCQIHNLITPSTLGQILTKQVMPLRRQLTKFFGKYSIELERQSAFRRRMENEFIKAFNQPIPVQLKKRIDHENQIMESIQYQLEKDQLILKQTADGYNTYYLTNQTEFQMKSLEYIQDHLDGYYRKVYTIDEVNTEEQHLNEIVKSMNLALNQMELKGLISMDYLQKIRISDTVHMKLPYLYFLPEPSNDTIMYLNARLSSCYKSPIYLLATNIEQVLRPLFERYAQSTRIINGTDFIQKLQQFTLQSDSFTLNTRFITFEIHNLSTRVLHKQLIETFKCFLNYQFNTKPQDQIKVERITELVKLVLSHNMFTYNGTIYCYIRGGPMNLPLIELLHDIYLQYWQVPLVSLVRLNHGFYGRYQHKGFLTWNGSTESFGQCIIKLNKNYPDIQLTESTGFFVHFLDVYIENVNGHLMTCVHHDKNQTQLFRLPYANKHPRITHRQWFRFALARAIQYCPLVADFQEERLQIELTFLANGYSLDFIEYLTQQFLHRFFPSQKSIYFNQTIYNSFRKQVFQYYNEQNHHHLPMEFSYLYDWGRRHEFNQKFYQLWSETINNDPNFRKFGLKIRLTTKHCYLSSALLAQ